MRNFHIYILTAGLLLGLISGGCRSAGERVQKPEVAETEKQIGSLVDVVGFEPIAVEGYGLVAGLSGTGSSECPSDVRDYLEQYILRELPKQSKMSARDFINSKDTAVVRIQGFISAGVSKGQHFDVLVSALEGTQTTSLAGGYLYTAELSPYTGVGKSTRILGEVRGAVYVDRIGGEGVDEREGCVLGGGQANDSYRIELALREPEYRTASGIRNRINERFEEKTAVAVSRSLIYLNPPAEYKWQKGKFVELVKAMYLVETPQLAEQRISKFTKQLAEGQNVAGAEMALEVIGNSSLGKLAELLKSPDEKIRFSAAKCMLNLKDDRGLGVLREIALHGPKELRIEAAGSIGRGAKRNEAMDILRPLLSDKDFAIRFAAYEHLLRLDDMAISRRLVSGDFYLDSVQCDGPKAIYISRKDEPKIVLFGFPVTCKDDFFVESKDGRLVINSGAGEKYVSLMRRHPRRSSLIGPLRSSPELGDIVLSLAESPVNEKRGQRIGLGLPYCEVAEMLGIMCEKGAVEAEFHIGEVPAIMAKIKKTE